MEIVLLGDIAVLSSRKQFNYQLYVIAGQELRGHKLEVIKQMIDESDCFELEVRSANNSPKTEKPAT